MTAPARAAPESLVMRTDVVLRPDPARVIPKLFLPGQEVLIRGDSRAEPVIRRLMQLPETVVQDELAATRAAFATRYRDLDALLMSRFAQIAPRFDDPGALSRERQLLAGAYFTMEFAIETAALFNPSMVPHPDQSDLPAGSVRFVMSVRAVGEGHISSIEFRTGTVDAAGRVRVDDPGRSTVLPDVVPTRYAKEVFIHRYGRRRPDGESAEFIFERLPDRFDSDDLAEVLAALHRQALTRGGTVLNTIERFQWMANSTYSICFPEDSTLAQRVIHPIGPAESHGLEDVRLTQYFDAEGTMEYRGTYTAFSGDRVEPHILRTPDFRTFQMSQIAGTAAANKGMAFFPRPIGGRDLALSRWDRERIWLAEATGLYQWDASEVLEEPDQAWNLVQSGNCGPPIATERGWLVLTHGVGPMRHYTIGATLLDLDDPTRVLGRLPEPLLQASEDERTGYVPNVVYSCGGMRHGDLLVLPYGCSDAYIRFAVIDLPGLVAALLDHGPR